MNIKKTMLKLTTVVAVVGFFIGCEDEFETVGSNVIGEPNFNAALYDGVSVAAVNEDLGPVQTNNLPNNLLGFYADPVFGDHTANILTELSLSTVDPEFGNEPVLDSVVLYIPYFSEQTTDEEGNATYELDSIYGGGPINVQVLETNFYLNDYDPDSNFQEAQKYYSDLGTQVMENLTGVVLGERLSFEPSSEEVLEYTATDTVELGPGLKIELDKEYFQTRILNREGATDLSSPSNFKDYLRSIYLKAEAVGTNGSMMLLNLAHQDAGIKLFYTVQATDTDDTDDDGDTDEVIPEQRSFKLNLGPARVNTFEQQAGEFPDASSLYLKGGEGSMVVIDLFGQGDADNDQVPDELEELREKDWLINEANLEFYVNRDVLTGVNEPEHLYLYDLENNFVLADYVFDSPGEENAMTSVSNYAHFVPLEKDADDNGILYKIRITRHINNILNNDSTNVRLGLVVAENVNLLRRSDHKMEASPIEAVPATSVITPEATVLYGPAAQNEEKRLKLKIYYTESK